MNMNATNQNSRNNDFTLIDLLSEQTRDLYDAENSHHHILLEMDNISLTPELTDYLSKIASDTVENIHNLIQICSDFGVPHTGVTCAAMEGLVRECKGTARDWESSAVRDAALIANEQRIVHYQIAGYGTAKAFAQAAKQRGPAKLFEEMLKRAYENDKTLTKIACGGWIETGVNELAVAGE